MENKQATAAATTTTSHPLGMCEKLFHAFEPTFRPLRRLTFRQHDPDYPVSTPAPPGKTESPKNAPQKELPTPAPPKAEVRPLGPLPQPSQPPPPKVKVAKLTKGQSAIEKAKKGFNEKVDDYIKSSKVKIRTGSNVGKASAAK